MPSPLFEPILELADTWRSATGPSRRRLATAVVSLVWAIGLLVAREGTPRSRAGAVAMMAGAAALAVGWRLMERRALRDPAQIVRGLASGVDPDRANRVLRALSLVAPRTTLPADGTSAALASVHVSRVIADLPSTLILDRSSRHARLAGAAALLALACTAAIGAARGWSVLEGADVLVARHGLAPVSMRWLDDVDVIGRPPDYLQEPEQPRLAYDAVSLPYGTRITVRGMPLHLGRRLALSDGNEEVPLVEDGSGALVARWLVTKNASVRVVARFGDVVIEGPELLATEVIPDQAPKVVLEGAPRKVMVVEEGDGDIPIRYEATDDHGLREVHLVLRSGVREERRVLARLDGQTKSDKGGSLLKLRDPFLKKSHAPVDVTVEAKDSDPLTGPKWGTSLAIVVVPPNVGEPEALRVESLRRLRDALVDSLAWRLSNAPPAGGKATADFVAKESERARATDALLSRTLSQVIAGTRMPLRVRATLTAQGEAMRKTVDRETKHPSAAAHADVVRANEHFALIVDAVTRGLGMHDARDAARQLADVADDLALGASQAHADAQSSGALHMDAATAILSAGAHELARLGTLGRDLGEIVDADLLRVKRARKDVDLVHAELAARDLAARLHLPDSSFGAPGGGFGHGGGESGGAHGTEGDQTPSPDDVDQAFQEAAREVEQLAQDHAGEVQKMEQVLAGATSDAENDELRQDAKRHAEAVREAASALPSVGSGSDSWTSKGAAARELAEQMARSLESGRPADAVESGNGSIGALNDAQKMLDRGGWLDDPTGAMRRRVDVARQKLDVEEKWAAQELERFRKRAAERARQPLQQGGNEEGKLADRARDLAERSNERGSLPEQAVQSLRDAERAAREAADALRRGDATRGLESQREAQRSLESASEQVQGEESEGNDAPSSEAENGLDGNANASHGNVPGAGEHKGPEEFRRRVMRGLGQPASGALKDIVRRYAEGLLR